MKKQAAKKIQKLFKAVSINSAGRSFPPGIFEKRIPKEVREQMLKK